MEGQTLSWTPEADVRQFMEVFGTSKDLLPDGVSASDIAATGNFVVNKDTPKVA